jgi:hypothetical protein
MLPLGLYKILVGKLKGRDHLEDLAGRLKRRIWEEALKADLKHI